MWFFMENFIPTKWKRNYLGTNGLKSLATSPLFGKILLKIRIGDGVRHKCLRANDSYQKELVGVYFFRAR